MKNLELRMKNLPSAELQRNWKLKIENGKLKHEGKGMKACFQSPTSGWKPECLPKCRSDWKEREAQSTTDASLLAIGSLQFAEGTSIRFSKSLEYVYYSLLLLFTKKKRLIEPKDLNNGDFTWNRVLAEIVG